MSKAEELLNSLVEAYVAESNPSSDSHIVIGVDRFITVPDELKRIAVQYDHNMRTVTFDCPRYYDGRDMSKMKVYINIRGPKGARYSYIADNVRVDTSNPIVMHFDWTIRRPITDVNGKLIFLVCIRKADSTGNEENHWNSELNTDLYISEGMEYEEFEEHPYSDIVTQLLQRMDDVEALATPEAMQGHANAWLEANSNTVLAEVQAKGNEVLASIPEEYSETYSYAAEGARAKADAIIRTVEGESIAVSDSSDDYLRGLRVFGKTTQVTTTGKNLADASVIRNTSQITNDNGAITVTTPEGSSAVDTMVNLSDLAPKLKVGSQFILTFETTGTANYVYLEEAKKMITSGVVNTATQEMLDSDILLYASGVSTTATITNIMIRDASVTDSTYEPYSGGTASPSPDHPQELVSVENPTVNILGKNILDETQLTYHPDYKDMYSSALAARNYHVEKGKTYTLSFDTENTGVLMYVNPSSGFEYEQFVMDGTRHSFTTTMKKDIVSSGTSMPIVSLAETSAVECGLISNVLIEMCDSDTEYEPYKELQTVSIVRTLPGIPVTHGGNYTDANSQQWVCDEVDFERGVYVKRIGIHNIADYTDGCIHSDNTMHSDTILRFDFGYQLGSRQQTPVLCNRFVNKFAHGDNVAVLRATELISSHSVNDVISVFIDKTRLATPDLAGFEEWLNANPTIVHCILATPIETPLSAEELAAFRAIRTNYPNTTVLNDSNVKMELKYNADTQLYIDNKIAEAVAALANKA